MMLWYGTCRALCVVGSIGDSELVTLLILKDFGVWHSAGMGVWRVVTSRHCSLRVDCGKDLQNGE